jgi:hypothetical protein
MKRAAARRILFVGALVVITTLMTTSPIAAEPLLTPSQLIVDTGDEVLEIAEQAKQMVGWILGDDNGNDADESLVT